MSPTHARRQSQSPKDRALAWWHQQVKAHRYVIPVDHAPARPVAKALLSGGYVLEVAGRRVWILKTPDNTDDRATFLANYWPVVRLVTDAYAPAAVTGLDAVRLHVGNATAPAALRVRHAANASKYRLVLFEGFMLHLLPGTVSADAVTTVATSGSDVPLEREAVALFNVLGTDLEGTLDADLAAWLRTLVVSTPELRDAYRANPQPVTAKRMAELAALLGNTRLASQLTVILTEEYGHHVSATKTGVGTRITVPPHLVHPPVVTGRPWLDRSAAQWAQFETVLHDRLGPREAALPRRPMRSLLAHARKVKSYDAYHSTTIEGYRVSPDEADALLQGKRIDGTSPVDVESRMAVLGYGRAFDRVLSLAEQRNVPISEHVILDLYVDLFWPSVEAGIFSAGDLRGWRTAPVQIRGSRYVPPSEAKVPPLMSQFVDLLGRTSAGPVSRAVLAHHEFAAIHPFRDGNGRIARLLMNLLLLRAGLPWITIRNDERAPYFAALERASVEGDITPFALFILRYAETQTSSR